MERDAGSCTAGKKAAGAERTASMVSEKRLCERERVIDDAQQSEGAKGHFINEAHMRFCRQRMQMGVVESTS